MEDIEMVLEQLTTEIINSLKAMNQAKDIGKRKDQAEIVYLLCRSMGSVLGSATSAAMADMPPPYFFDDDEDEEEEDFS